MHLQLEETETRWARLRLAIDYEVVSLVTGVNDYSYKPRKIVSFRNDH